MFDIESIQALCKGKAIRFSIHFGKRQGERNITRKQITQAIMSGEIIEEIPDDKPLPSVLILGYTTDGRPLHVATGIDDSNICIITAYFPNPDLWEPDNRTRRSNP